MMLLRVGSVALCIATVAGHGCITFPTSRNAVDAHEVSCDANTDGCSAKAVGDGCVNATHPGQPCKNGQASFWYSQGCFIGCPECDHLSGRRQTDLCKLGKKATLPQYARSVNLKAPRFSELDIYQHNPWSAPGSAPVADACGLAGGSPWDWNRAEAGNYVNTTHARHGQKGTTLPAIPTGIEWKIGGEAEVQWQVRNNHGGGYSYRLCPAESPLTEECFKKHQLDFVPEKAALLFPDGTHMMINGTYVGHDAATRNVTDPPGSMWARIPIAPTALGPVCIPGPHDDPNAPHSCAAKNNHAATGPYPGGPCGCSPCPQTPGSDCSRCDGCGEPAFPPFMHEGKPVQGVGPVIGMVDSVKVPANLAPGKYILGFRYDCEATAQVWSNCADITLVK